MTSPHRRDAWYKLDRLVRKNTKCWELRDDLFVVAEATERKVSVNDTRHNVTTVREYIAVLEAACDFVEAKNPEWAAGLTERTIRDPSDYETTEYDDEPDESCHN